ncbi:hypothetical protein CBR_g55460 [Chara braunii]|uniref:Uncharacterized protein n=1 Tax=Chara braunii TaxID=69332 RepID=A0A388K7W6_CHABU|nr:hypothetical protein CBR_g55460 [Chara braunii]|eukprot:GBG66116.1 hypothetical protein CBR_g55460 [Chara braunii]
MAFKISRSMKNQVRVYKLVEFLESGAGFLVLTVLTVDVGTYGTAMSARILWLCVALFVLEVVSKVMRGIIYKEYFQGMSCAQVSKSQGQSSRMILGSFHVLNGKVRSTFAYVSLSAFVRLCAMIAQLGLGVRLYRAIPDLTRRRDYHEDWAKMRAHEFIAVTCICLLLHSLLMCILIFFGLEYALFRTCLYALEFRRCRDMQLTDNGHFPFWERFERIRLEIETGVTWYFHYNRHFCFQAVEAHSNKTECGLPGYWFYSVKELVDMVREDLPDLYEEVYEGRKGKTSGKKVDMALGSLKHLSKQNKMGGCELFASDDEMAKHMQDLSQASRCKTDVDASRDFARAQGYLAMLRVIKSSAPNSDYIKMAASILAGFASSLSVLPWQPSPLGLGDGFDSQHFILSMLQDDDFRSCTVQLLHSLIKQFASVSPDSPLNGSSTFDLQDATLSAICSFANAASDIHAHHDDLKTRGLCPSCLTDAARRDAPAGQEDCCEVQITPSRSGGEGPTKRREEDPEYYKMQFSNSFTTLRPLGWPLETPIPDFHGADNVWVCALNGVRSALGKQETVDILLNAAIHWPNLSSSIVTDCVRTLSCLWSRRMIKWHRFDEQLLNDFPQPMALIEDLERADAVREKLKSLVDRFSEFPPDSMITAPFCNLHVAKILISQGIRDVDAQVAKILLQCLCYWRRALGSRELDWFACETIETLRDLFVTSTEQDSLKLQIWQSSGGVNCLRLMLNDKVSVSRSVRFCREAQTFGHRFREHMVSVQDGGEQPWAYDAGTHTNRCVAAAARLFAELIQSNKGFNILSQPQDGEAFFETLIMSLSSILAPEPDQRAGQLDRSRTDGPPGRSIPGTNTTSRSCSSILPLLNITARLVLLFWESLGNPAWRPVFGLFENINSALTESSEHRLEYFETAVNNLLAKVYAARIASYVVDRCPQLFETSHTFCSRHLLNIFLPPLVDHFVLPGAFPRLQRRLGLDEWQVRLREEANNLIAKVLIRVIPRAYELQQHPTEGRGEMERALDDLNDWAIRLHIGNREERQKMPDMVSGLVDLVHRLHSDAKRRPSQVMDPAESV